MGNNIKIGFRRQRNEHGQVVKGINLVQAATRSSVYDFKCHRLYS